jgi:PKD repeat protein
LKQLADNQENVIPLIWQGDTANASPGYGSRASQYGVGSIPHAQFQGNISDVGGGSTYPRYLNYYNNAINTDSPIEIEVSLDFNAQGQLVVQGDIYLQDNLTTTNNKVVFLLSRFINADYFCSVAGFSTQDLTLSSAGESGTFTHSFTLNPDWNLGDLKGIVLVQSWQSKYIVQAAQSGFTGLVPLFSANVTQGPPALGVQFIDYSMPAVGIESWEWDLNGDGITDSNEQNPYYLYEEPGNYNVNLKITKEGEVQEITKEDFIQVTNSAPFSGELSGIWHPEWNPYIIENDVSIQANDQLMIHPGVVVQLNNDSVWEVFGTLQAVGESSEPIHISSNNAWKGIRFQYSTNENIIKHCHISKATDSAIFINESKVDIIGNAIFDNYCASFAGAIEMNSANDVLIQQNFITNNSSNAATGAIGCTASSPMIANNIIVNNQANPAMPATAGAFVLKSGSNPMILNNTISHNVASNAIFVVSSEPTIENSIVLHDGQIVYEIASLVTVNYSCISGNYIGMGNIDADPLFAQTSEGDGLDYSGFNGRWYVMENSPTIDAGNPNEEHNDIEDPANPGNPLWPAMGTLRNDMGAFGGTGFANIFDFVDSDESTVPHSQNLMLSNYPNPFNPETKIQFSTEQSGIAQVTIYNSKGQKIITLFDNEVVNSRLYEIVWNGKDDNNNAVASGVYMYKLDLNGKTEAVRRCILLK